jgi:hypothetical protein
VPVEEPSTASIADSCTAANNSLFDHLVVTGISVRIVGTLVTRDVEALSGIFGDSVPQCPN